MSETMLKEVPCNNCRRIRRKCSREQPCLRCIERDLDCTYTVSTSPRDLEYAQEAEYSNQVRALESQIESIENQIKILKLAQENESISGQSASFSSIDSFSLTTSVDERVALKNYDEQLSILLNQPDSLPTPHDTILERRKSYRFLEHEGISVDLSKEKKKPWKLTVKSGNMVIDTHINSYAQLMSYLNDMVPTAVYHKQANKLRFPLNTIPNYSTSGTNKILNVITWRTYGRSRFVGFIKYIPIIGARKMPRQLTHKVSIEELNAITMHLVSVYIQCMHYTQLMLYMPAFAELFLSSAKLSQSPAIMALCSTICQQSCRHIHDILPKELLEEYGLFYFEQARELIEDRFDEFSLDTIITYTCLAKYRLGFGDSPEAKRYLDMAERIHAILLQQYQRTSKEFMLLDRVFRQIHSLRLTISLDKGVSDMFRGNRNVNVNAMYNTLLQYQDGIDIRAFPGDTSRETQFIEMHHYLSKVRTLAEECRHHISQVADYPTHIGMFGHHMEMALRTWYRDVLPPEFQLSLPLFDDFTNDVDFFNTLAAECESSPIALLTTIKTYNEYLVMGRSFFPLDPPGSKLETEELLLKFRQTQYHTQHGLSDRRDISLESDRYAWYWLSIVKRVKQFKHMNKQLMSEAEQEMSDDEFLEMFVRALNPSKINLDMSFIRTTIISALNLVRLAQFLVSRQDMACHLDLKWVMAAWDVLLVAARGRYQKSENSGVTLERIYANLLICIDIVKEHLELSNNPDNGSLASKMKDEFDEIL